MRAVADIQERDRGAAAPWMLWGMDPVALHDRLWLAQGVRVIRPGAQVREDGNARRYLALPDEHQLAVALEHRQSQRGTHRVRAVASCRTTYHEYLDFDDDRVVRSIRRLYGPNGSARPDCLFTPDAELAQAVAGDARAMDRLNGSAPHASSDAGLMVFDGRDPEECARWLGALADSGVDLAGLVPGVKRIGARAWGPAGGRVPPSVRLAGAVFVGRGVELPAGSVVVGPAVLPDGWTDEDCPTHGHGPTARPVPRRQRAGKPVYELTKRAFDLVVASAMLVLAAPVMGVIAIAIRMQDGSPIIFRQARQTRDGRHFACLKFRTMVRNADELQEELRAQNQVDGPQFAMKHDPRILPIGRWLRKTQLDELPQLWNVIRGEMSLVGPRPSPEYENQCCPPWREARLSVPAGITGLWQVRRRREPDTDFQEWIRYDIEYAARRGWLLDLSILVATAWLYVPCRARAGRLVLGIRRRIGGRRTRGTRRT